MADNLEDAIRWTLGKEAGWYPGGLRRDPNPTMDGVTQQTYDAWRKAHGLAIGVSVQLIGADELRAIYSDYWTPAGCALVGPITAVTLFDMSINGGSGTAARLLQRALGIPVDGVLGTQTRTWIARYNDRELADRFEWERVRRYLDIVQKNPAQAPNLLGWMIRVTQFREQYLSAGGSGSN